MIFVYRMLIAPAAALLLPFAALFNGKLRAGLRLRRERRAYPELSQRPIWIHASSGEFEYAKSLIRELKARLPMVPVVVTYFSPTYAKNVQNFPGVDFALPLPLDLPGPVSSFLKRTNPRALLLSRTDFWPEALTQKRARKIPVQVFSYTQKSPAQMGFFAKVMARWRLSLVDEIHCVSPDDKINIETLKVATPVHVLGDTRKDQVKFRLDHPKELPASLKPPAGIPVLVAGSTWPEDEKVLLPAAKPLLAEGKLLLILAPHEPTEKHLADIKAQLKGLGLEYALFSAASSWNKAPVLLVDQVGWLAELYAWGDMAFVGGSFRKTVHSVMEALGAGLKTFVGPLHTNNREAIEFQGVMSAVTVVRDAGEMQSDLGKLSPSELRKFKTEFSKEFAARLGATNKLIESVRVALQV
jgi:3-deoxy-D-manno-octulosonic-acid transferase